MIAFLEGVLAGKTQEAALINVGGVGFSVAMSSRALSKLPAVGEDVSIHTFMQVSESALALYGFLSTEEKGLFEQLITVSGVGPKVALCALSSFEPAALIAAIQAQDVNVVKQIPGVGKKTASRIILELKGSFDKVLSAEGEGGAAQSASAAEAQNMKAAHEALLALGFASEESTLALKGAPDATSEDVLLKYALKRLGK